ncbi:hypothetical protein [Halobaculum magnesiiphilum]|uniref:Uncharacterized protein n=1 Tax=Halobaculum magnesiiphilum TaxID=1017351 RepID=A0A8T8WA31_9EURY|nr:hypothetical protein [Halobaculum magnesiiphilum]QZP36613.1 hypothetical protein K6T50_09825 [Halobaculum magnesiiphilum]
MNRRAPELALLTGLLLAAPTGAFALWATGDISRSLLTGVGLLYPFALYAIYHDDDPTTVLPPRAVALAGTVVGAVLVADATVTATGGVADATLRGTFLGLVVAAPAWAYAVGYAPARSLPGGRAILLTGAVGGAALLLAGLLLGTPFGAAAALLVWVFGALAARSAGLAVTPTARLGAVAGGVVLGVAVLFAALIAGSVSLAAVLSALALALAPAVFYGLTVETASFE